MAKPILQTLIPESAPWRDSRGLTLPGIKPAPIESWLLRDEAFAEQMALRDRLITKRRGAVIAMEDSAADASAECLDVVLGALDDGYAVTDRHVTRPDGRIIEIDRDDPWATLGQLVQSDLCLMQAGADGHVLSAAVLCFPASWTLAEKIAKPLPMIHRPVAEYDDTLAKRVERLFQAIKPGIILTRANLLTYEKADLFAPQSEDAKPSYLGDKYLRTERQTLRRLPRTNAVVFGIHTTVMDMATLPEDDRRAILEAATSGG